MRQFDDYKKTMTEPDALPLAAKQGDIQRVQQFVAAGADINATDHRGYSPLMLACYNGNEEMAAYLIENGADVNSADPAGNTILMGVCFKGYLPLAQMLLAAHANAETRNKGNQTAYDIALQFGRADIAELLKLR